MTESAWAAWWIVKPARRRVPITESWCRRVAGPSVVRDWIRVLAQGWRQESFAGRDRPKTHGRLPAGSAGWQSDLAEDEVGDAVQDVLLARDVVVEGHRLDPELLPEPANGQRLDPARVGKNEGGTQDALPAQRGPALGVEVGLTSSRAPGSSGWASSPS